MDTTNSNPSSSPSPHAPLLSSTPHYSHPQYSHPQYITASQHPQPQPPTPYTSYPYPPYPYYPPYTSTPYPHTSYPQQQPKQPQQQQQQQPPKKRPRYAFVNGRIIPVTSAGISITDTGFTHGSSITELGSIIHSQPIQLDNHLTSFINAITILGITLPITREVLHGVVKQLIKMNSESSSNDVDNKMMGGGSGGSGGGGREILIMQVSLGVSGRIRMIGDGGEVEGGSLPTVVVWMEEVGDDGFGSKYSKGVSLMGGEDDGDGFAEVGKKEGGIAMERLVFSAGVIPGSTSVLGDVLALRLARKRGYDDAIIFDARSGDVVSTTLGALFVVKFGVIYTPPVIGDVKGGLMRGFVIKVVREARLVVREIPLTPPFLRSASEVFIANIPDEVCPVCRIGKKELEDSPGPVTRNVISLVMTAIEREIGKRHDRRDVLEAIVRNKRAAPV